MTRGGTGAKRSREALRSFPPVDERLGMWAEVREEGGSLAHWNR